LPLLPPGATPDQRKQALQAFNVATGNYRQYNVDAGGTRQVIGMNNVGEVTFVWPSTDQKKVIHTVRWRDPNSFLPLFVDYAVSLDPNDPAFPYAARSSRWCHERHPLRVAREGARRPALSAAARGHGPGRARQHAGGARRAAGHGHDRPRPRDRRGGRRQEPARGARRTARSLARRDREGTRRLAARLRHDPQDERCRRPPGPARRLRPRPRRPARRSVADGPPSGRPPGSRPPDADPARAGSAAATHAAPGRQARAPAVSDRPLPPRSAPPPPALSRG